MAKVDISQSCPIQHPLRSVACGSTRRECAADLRSRRGEFRGRVPKRGHDAAQEPSLRQHDDRVFAYVAREVGEAPRRESIVREFHDH
jgi:hypothetical protein